MPSSELLRVFSALEQARVRYLVVDGVAVVLHGHLRVTADLDVVVGLEPANARAAVRALAELDLFVREPFDFDTTYARAVMVELEGIHVSVIGIADLIALKRAAGRGKDLEDADALAAILEEDRDG